jgi:hypothetical protein
MPLRAAYTAAADPAGPPRFLAQLHSGALDGAGIDLGQNFFHAHAPGTKRLAVKKGGRHPHDFAAADFVLKQRAIDAHAFDVGVEYAHGVERLHHLGTVVTGEREKGLKAEAAGQIADLFHHRGVQLGGMTAGLQQRQHQRGEFVAHGDAGETDARAFALATDGKRRLARVIAIVAHRHPGGQRGNIQQQLVHFHRFGAVVQRSHQFDRLHQSFEVGFELGLYGLIEHVGLLARNCMDKASLADAAKPWR